MGHFRNSMDPVEKRLRDGGIDTRNIHDVVLVDSATRIPEGPTMFQGFSNEEEPCKSIIPEEAVAFGAAVQAAILTDEGSSLVQDSLPDAASLSMGSETVGGVMTKLIVPPSRPRRRSSFYAGSQPGVLLTCPRASAPSPGPFSWASSTWAASRLPCGVPQIEVSFDIAASGIPGLL